MKKLLLLLSLPALVLTTSCDGGESADGTDTTDTTATEVDTKGMDELDLTDHYYDLTIMVPNKDEAMAEPVVTYNEGLDNLLIQVGEKFQLELMMDMPDFEALKSDLEADITFTNEIIKEEPDYIIWESSAADLDRTFFHFYMTRNIGGEDYIFTDAKKGEFNQMNIDKMIKSAKTVAAKQAA